jgi:hypothetical protein
LLGAQTSLLKDLPMAIDAHDGEGPLVQPPAAEIWRTRVPGDSEVFCGYRRYFNRPTDFTRRNADGGGTA